jgi:choline-sulfatase
MKLRYSKLLFILWLMVAFLTGIQTLSAGMANKPNRKPNVLIIFPDQLRWSEVGCYGNKVIRTPNIDRLAATGIRFTEGFSNFPVCSPARSILLSGRYARSNGLFANQDNPASPGRPTNRDTTIAEVLSSAGYMTGLVGKWHLAPQPQILGFKESLRPFFRHRYYQQQFFKNEGKPYVWEGFSPFHEADAAVKFIRQHKDKPFFLFYSLGPPHMPVDHIPDKYRKMYDPAKLPIRPNAIIGGKLAYDEEWFKIYMWDFLYYLHQDTFKQELPAGMDLRDLTALYYGQTTVVDDCVGRVLDALKDLGLQRDTIVVFTSDHGDLLGSHGLFNKNTHHEESIRVPMIIRYPRKFKQRVIDEQIISLVDVMPTLLELCGLRVPASVQGTSLAKVLNGLHETVGENVAFIETTEYEGVRTKRYVYYCDRNTYGDGYLFDIEKDPYEFNNAVKEPAYQDVLARLRNLTKAWRERTPVVKSVGLR